MKLSLQRPLIASLAFATLIASAVLPASAQEYQGASNHNIWSVRRNVDFDIRRLQHDQRDYHGFRDAAINDLQRSRNELLAAEQFAHRRPEGGFGGVQDSRPDDRGQRGSNRDLWKVRGNVQREYAELARDDRDYGGHKDAAMQALQQASNDLLAAERFARHNGY